MDIISGKTDQVDEQEYHREAKIQITIPLEIEPQPESDRNRNPAEIKYACKKVRYLAIMNREILAKNQDISIIVYTEQTFFQIIQTFHINRVGFVVWENTHPVV